MVAKIDVMGRPAKPQKSKKFRQRVGILLRAAREAKGLTVAQLAADTKISKPSISCYENATRALQLDDLPTLAKALGVSVHELIPNE